MTHFIAVFILLIASFLLGLSVRRRHDFLYDHDPNKPYTSTELRRMGIQPPDDYDRWLDKFDGGAGRTAYRRFPEDAPVNRS